MNINLPSFLSRGKDILLSEPGVQARAIVLTAALGLALAPLLLLARPGNAAYSASMDLENSDGSISSQAANASSSLQGISSSGALVALRPLVNPPQSAPLPGDIKAGSTSMDSEDSKWLLEDLLYRELPVPRYPATPPNHILPDSELVFSPGAKDFDISAFVREHGGFLNTYREQVGGTWVGGAEIVELVAQNNSVNPRLLLAIVEHRSGWLTDPQRPSGEGFDFPIRSGDRMNKGLHSQLTWAAGELSRTYYGQQTISYEQRELENMPSAINAGTVALNRLLEEFCSAPDCTTSFMATYHRLFGDPWEYEIGLFDEALVQPSMILPFPGANEWIFTGGPHGAWGSKTPWAALDFAPMWDSVRRTSDKDVIAVADGVIARVGQGVLVLDLDGDGYEQTGWSILYLHVIRAKEITEGTYVRQGQIIGQASSLGGVAAGEHLHIARKYNGEWILADGSTPFELGGWRALAGAEAYQGKLYNNDRMCEEAYFTVPIGGTLRAAQCRSMETVL